MNLPNTVPFDKLLWLVPFFFMLHNMEEAPFMEKWSSQLPVKIKLIKSTKQFVIAVIILTIISFLLTYLGLNVLPKRTGHMIILGIQMTLALNVFIPHLFSTIRFRMYSPGLITALFIILPFSIYLFHRALNDNLLAQNEFWLLFWLSPIIMIASVFISLKLGKLLS